jgi:transposase
MVQNAHTPNPANASLSELHLAAKSARSMQEHDRIRAIIALILGVERVLVAGQFDMDDRTVRRWILDFNERGIDGLLDEPRSGRPRKIPPELIERCVGVLQEPAKADVVHWTGVKFHGWLREELEVEIGYSTVIRFLHEQGFTWTVPQPWPDRQDEEKRAAFREKLRELASDPDVELWFSDEMGVEGDPRPRRRWSPKGSSEKVTKNGDHVRMNVAGTICPRNGEFYGLEFTHMDTEVFQCFLDHANADLTFERKRQVFICDNASWHKRKNLTWGRFEPLFLPAYSPDLNPIEKLWLVIKAEWFTDYIAKDHDQLIQRLDAALVWAMNRKNDNQQTCAIRTKL